MQDKDDFEKKYALKEPSCNHNHFHHSHNHQDDDPVSKIPALEIAEAFVEDYVQGKGGFRRLLPQILATIAKNLLLLSYGMTLGVATIAVPALSLQKKFDEHIIPPSEEWRRDKLNLTPSEADWFKALNYIFVPIGCLFSGPITQPFGRKKSMMMLNIPFFMVFVLYYFATSPTWLFLALMVSGLSGGLHEAPVLTYVAEITDPKWRGLLSAASPSTVIMGAVSQAVMGRYMFWRNVMLVNMCVPICAVIAISFIVESPHWLISRNRLEDARKSLQWLRGWVPPEMVEKEFEMLKSSILSKSAEELDSDHRISFNIIARSFRSRTFVIPYLIIMVVFCIGQFGGMTTIPTNSYSLFGKLGTSAGISVMDAPVMLGLCQFIGVVCCFMLVRWTGKRALLISSHICCSLCYFLLAAHNYARDEKKIQCIDTLFDWAPLVLLNAISFFLHVGVRILPWVLVGEMFPTDIRAFASGASALWFYGFGAGAQYSFDVTVQSLRYHGLFIFYGSMMLLGTIFIYFFLPETEGVRLFDIERHFATKGNIFRKKIRTDKDYKIWSRKNSGQL